MSLNAWRQDISSNGVARMIVVINSKLKEMTGSEDRTLADYVVILVQSGKTEEEIKKTLETFLRDRSGPFVSWLFDHLASHMHHYTSPQPKIQSANPRNIFSETRSKNDQTESSINANFLGGSLVGSAKQTQRNPNYIDGEEEGNNTDIARKSIFERLGKFHEWNKNFDGEVENRNRKRSISMSDTDFPTSKRPKLEYNRELPVTRFVSSSPTKPIRTTASTRKVFGTPRKTLTKAKRSTVFDRLGQKVDPRTKGFNRVAVNEGNHTSQNLEIKSVVVSNVHYGATSKALTQHFMSCGEVTSVHMLKNISTGSPTGTAFVEFASKEAANRALSMDGSTFMYRKLQVAPKSLAHTTTVREHINFSHNFQWRRDPSTTDNLANSRKPATSSNIANSGREHIHSSHNFQWRRDPSTTDNLANSRKSATSSNIANSGREHIHSSHNFQWRRDPLTTDNLANSRKSATSSNIANSRRLPTYQRNPPQKPAPAWKF